MIKFTKKKTISSSKKSKLKFKNRLKLCDEKMKFTTSFDFRFKIMNENDFINLIAFSLSDFSFAFLLSSSGKIEMTLFSIKKSKIVASFFSAQAKISVSFVKLSTASLRELPVIFFSDKQD